MQHLIITIRSLVSKHVARGDRAIWIICLISVVIGSIFRFVNLDNRIFLTDEIKTALQVGGYYDEAILPRIYDTYISAGEVLTYEQSRAGATVFDTFQACRLETPFNPPLYFVLGRVWAGWFGPEVDGLRKFSALISLFEIPCFYLLGLELFGCSTIAATVTALCMVAPYNLPLAQFARPYSLWTVLILLSSVLLLRASRNQNRSTWEGFILAATLSLYTHLSALRILLSQIIYGCLEKARDRQYKLAPLLVSCSVAFVLFIPWLIEVNNHLYPSFRGANWFSGKTSTHRLLIAWCDHLTRLYVDLDYIFPPMRSSTVLVTLLLEVAAVFFFVKSAPASSRIFIISLFATTFLTLAVPDLILGGDRSTETRYMLPVALAVQYVVGYCLGVFVLSKKKIAIFSLVFIIAIEITSSWTVLNDRTWQGWAANEIAAASVINKCKKPIVLGWQRQKGWRDALMSFATQLRPDVLISFSTFADVMPIPAGVTDVFLWDPKPKQVRQLAAKGLYYQPSNQGSPLLWKLVNAEP